MMVGKSEDTEVQTFFNVRNLTNKDPVIVAGGPSGLPYDTVTTNPANYDSLGSSVPAGRKKGNPPEGEVVMISSGNHWSGAWRWPRSSASRAARAARVNRKAAPRPCVCD